MIHEVGNVELCELLETEQSAVQSMLVVLGHWHRLLHVRALLAKRKRGKSEIHQVYCGLSFNSGAHHQERTTSRTTILQEVGRHGTLHGQPVEEEMQEEILPGHPWQTHTRWNIPFSNNRKWSRRRCLSSMGWSRTKIIPTNRPNKNISITRVISGLLQTRQFPILCQWSTDLTSNKHCLLCNNWKKKKELHERQILQGMIFWIHLLYYRWIVSSWRRSTVTDGGCKYHTSNDVFSRCKSVHKMATVKGDDELIPPDNKLEVGTSYKLKLGPRWNWDQKWKIENWPWICVVTMHDADINDNMFIIVQDQRHDHFHWLPHCLNVSAHCSVSSCVSCHLVHTHRGSSNKSFIPSTCSCSCERFSSPCSSLLLHALLAALFPFLPVLEVRRLPPKESKDLSDEFSISTEVATSCLQGKHWVDIRLESVNKDKSHSWVRISHGLNSEQETSEVQLEEYAVRLNVGDFACWSKAKAKTTKTYSACSSTRTLPIGERKWSDVEPASRRRWSFKILVIKGFSSEQFCALSRFVWWSM